MKNLPSDSSYSIDNTEKNDAWRPADYEEQLKLLASQKQLMLEETLPGCPMCNSEELHFYYHEWGNKPRRIGTIWLWCSNNKIWTHLSRIELPPKYHYRDPYERTRRDQFSALERNNWLDRLDGLWKEGGIPHMFVIRHSLSS